MNERNPIVATDGRFDYRVTELVGQEPGGELFDGEAVGKSGIESVSIRTFNDRDLVDTRFRDRLLEAVKLHRVVQHAAIHPIRSFIELHHAPAVVFAPIQGQRLSRLLRDGAMPVRAAAAMGEQLASGLHALHSAGVGSVRPMGRTHQDLHPDTILLTHDGQAVMLEVGTARARIALDRPDISGQAPVPEYAAPERRQERDRPESDVYSLGVVLLQALSGLPPAPLPDDPEAHEQAAIAAVGAVPTAPKSVQVLLLEMLSFDPDDRPSAREVGRRLRAQVPDLTGPWLSAWTGERVPAPAPVRPLLPLAIAEVEEDEEPDESPTERNTATSGHKVEALRPLKKASSAERRSRRRRAILGAVLWPIVGVVACLVVVGVTRPEWLSRFGLETEGTYGHRGQGAGGEAAGAGKAKEAGAAGAEPPDGVQVVEVSQADLDGAQAPPPGTQANARVVGVEGDLPEAPVGAPAVAPPPEDAPEVLIKVVDDPPEAAPDPTPPPEAAAEPAPPPAEPAAEPAAAAPPPSATPDRDDILANAEVEAGRKLPRITRRTFRDKAKTAAAPPAFGEAFEPVKPGAPRVMVEVKAPMASALTVVCAGGARARSDSPFVELKDAPTGRCDVQALLNGRMATGSFELEDHQRVECRIDFADTLRCW